ncbi:dynamin family protein [Tepidiforma sp.]|uniref:dynamin family protein n=1 Tax=Tepidiforma sp. TaxID=2682230 RepID=UPI0026326EAC|nr:dynamin family protein [Tepidiforma sp.]MCX7617201.1 50S ribosome-binding GTPase [Tepidiforma sp.]
MTPAPGAALAGRLERVLRRAAADDLPDAAAELFAAADRLHGPLRVAVAGRVKAGKSTLLNALLGERLAATDAGECTRLVTRFVHDWQYRVTAVRRGGAREPLPFRRGARGLEIDLADADDIAEIEVGWPSRRLDGLDLIDTPGLGSLSPEVSARTEELTGAAGGVSRVDAVIYLMRHVHRDDTAFLEGFRDAGLPLGSPVTTVLVLSRADEIGGGRPDAMDSARRIAARYSADPRLLALAGQVIPVAGLLAETASTLAELEYRAIRDLAADPSSPALLLSVDRFRDPERSPLTAELRELLLQRFGLFGLRVAVAAAAEGRVQSSSDLARMLEAVSGIGPVREAIDRRLRARSQLLIVRSAVAAGRHIARQHAAASPAGAARLAAELDDLVASAPELGLLEAAHLAATGLARFSPSERVEADTLLDRFAAANLAPLPAGHALAAIDRWRERASDPLLDGFGRAAADAMTRAYEALYARSGG